MLDSAVTKELGKIHNFPKLANIPQVKKIDEDDERFINMPTLPKAALFGNVGEIINRVEPFTEADKAGLLMHFLTAFGSLIGRTAHFKIGQDFHYLKLNCVIVGASGFGRKGTAWSEIKPLLSSADESFKKRIIGGLSSGEGLIFAVRDPEYKETKKVDSFNKEITELVMVDGGVTDKRALIIETEFASVLQRSKREGNTLSAVVRQAWDSGTLRVMTKQAVEASNTHISIIGHITRDELAKHLTDTETANGFANRFLWACVRRSKYLPDGDSVPQSEINAIVEFLAEIKTRAERIGEMRRCLEAQELWYEVYPTLSDGHTGLLGAVTSRATAYVMRIACLYSLLQGKDHIGYDELKASLALWDYCVNSAKYIFGVSVGDEVADKIETALKGAGEIGLTRTQISKLFDGHQAGERIKAGLSTLLDNGRITSEEIKTGGRSKFIFRHSECEKSEKSELN